MIFAIPRKADHPRCSSSSSPPLTNLHRMTRRVRRSASCFASMLLFVAVSLNSTLYATTFTWAPISNSGNKVWSNTANWSGSNAPPTSGLTTSDLVFGGSFKLTPQMDSNFSILSLTFASGAGAFNLTSVGTEILTIGTGGITNSSSNVQTITSALILGAAQTWNGSSFGLTINSSTVSLGAFVLSINGTGTNTISSIISSNTAGNGLTKNGTGLLILSKANTYTGNTTINAGELLLTSTGSLASSSTIRLGDTIANSPSAMLTFGATSGGSILSSPLIVQASASGTTGTRTILGLATNGATNTYSGNITMNAGLTLQSAAVGGSVANGQGILLLQGGSVNVGTSTLSVNSNLRGNNADTYSIQGIVRINEAVTSSLATGGSIFKDGSGTLILQGTSNTYTGTDATALNPNGTQIGGGILGIFGDGSLGLAPSTATNNVFFTTSAVPQNADSIKPTLRADASNVTLAATRNINTATGVTGTFNANGNTFTINGNINGGGAIATTTGAVAGGIVKFTAANTYTGGTTVQSGTLLVNNTSGSGTGTGAVTVNSGGTLGGSGFINTGANNVTVGGTIAPGSAANTIGTLTLTTNSTVFGSSSTFLVDLSGATTDQLLTNGSFNLLAVGDTIQFNSLAALTQSSYTLATYSGAALGLFENVVNLPSGYNLVYNLGELDLVATPVPEPATWLGGALALAAVGFTQRRRFAQLVTRTA